ncbi:hypothetical protein M431DRAFT_554080, partial [Trichoderma harzianum CBS 226.95]
ENIETEAQCIASVQQHSIQRTERSSASPTKHHRLTAARRQHTVRKRVCAAMTLASWHRLCHSRNGKGASCAACLVIAVLEGPGSGTCGLSSARPAVPP